MNTVDIITWSVVASSFVGVLLLTNKNRLGWWFTIGNNIIWASLWIATEMYPLILISVLYMVLGVRGLKKWKKPITLMGTANPPHASITHSMPSSSSNQS